MVMIITYRYAKNLADGHGITWNPGMAPTEGYTNFLLVILLAPFIYLGYDCQAPCDYILMRSYPLLQAREVLRLLAEEGIEGSVKEAGPRGDGV